MNHLCLQDPASVLRLLLYQAVFFGTCTDAEMDPDIAVKLLEQFSDAVNHLPEADRRALLEVARQEAETTSDPAVRRFLQELPDNVVLPEQAA